MPNLSKLGLLSFLLGLVSTILAVLAVLSTFVSRSTGPYLFLLVPVILFVATIIISSISLKKIKLLNQRGRWLGIVASALSILGILVTSFFFYISLDLHYPYPLWSKLEYPDELLSTPSTYSLPIDSRYEAVEYARFLGQAELQKPLEGQYAQYNQYSWYARPGKSRDYYTGQEYWTVTWFKSPGLCGGSYGCQVSFYPNGELVGNNFSCSHGWNCE